MSSSTSSSSSPAPSSIPDMRIPDDSVIVHFTSVDPTHALDNPIHSIGGLDCECKVNSQVSDKLLKLLHLYRNLVSTNFEISINNVKHQLLTGDLKSRHIYDVLDKFFMDVPDIVALNASWLTKESVEYIVQKQMIHEDIKSTLNELNVLMTTETEAKQCTDEWNCQNTIDLNSNTKPQSNAVDVDESTPRSLDLEISATAEAAVAASSSSGATKTQKKKKAKRGKKQSS